MARVLLIGGGACGRALAGELRQDGHAVRIVTRSERGRHAIEAADAECWLGDPGRLATLRGALDGVTIACWMLGHVADGAAARDLHGPRLGAWLTQCVDSTARGLVYEASGTVAADVLNAGAATVEAACELHRIPHRLLRAEEGAWVEGARGAIDSLLLGC